MKIKSFRIYYRWRTETNDLNDKWETVETTSKNKARDHGKSIAAERAKSYAGKYWFIDVEPA